MAIVGGPGKHCAIQFSETSGVIVGCTVTCGAETPIRGLIAGLGHGACVMINEEQSEGIALPSICVSKGDKTLLVIGADDSFVSSAVSSGILYGAYHNYLCPEGVSALWNGVIGPKAVPSENSMCPAVTVGKHAVYATVPDNMATAPTEICFFDQKDGSLSLEDAVARYVKEEIYNNDSYHSSPQDILNLTCTCSFAYFHRSIVDLTEDTKEGAAKALLGSCKLSTVSSAASAFKKL
jgi:hypothetical protein